MTVQEFQTRRKAEVTDPMLDYYRSWSEEGEDDDVTGEWREFR